MRTLIDVADPVDGLDHTITLLLAIRDEAVEQGDEIAGRVAIELSLLSSELDTLIVSLENARDYRNLLHHHLCVTRRCLMACIVTIWVLAGIGIWRLFV